MTTNESLWKERWSSGRIGFHEPEPNARLRAHLERLVVPASANSPSAEAPTILVPLCGKSTDLALLARNGFAVTGIEFVPQAAEAFFEERCMDPRRESWHGYSALAADGVRIAVGDFFALSVPAEQRFAAAYDRAALIAVDPVERERYVATCLAALRPGARLLLVTLALENDDGSGPPFSVSAGEVQRLYAAAHIEPLASVDVTADEPRFKARGATRVLEESWLITTDS